MSNSVVTYELTISLANDDEMPFVEETHESTESAFCALFNYMHAMGEKVEFTTVDDGFTRITPDFPSEAFGIMYRVHTEDYVETHFAQIFKMFEN